MASYDTQQPDKRVRITDAAVAVFAQKGYHAARVSDVAKEAGVADGTIYLYFRNKEDLLLSIFEEKMEMLNSMAHGDTQAQLSLLTSMVQDLLTQQCQQNDEKN